MAVARKPAAPAAEAELVNFGNVDAYGGSFVLPEGKYAMWFEFANEKAHEKMGTRTPRLGVLITAVPLEGGEQHEQFLSLGRKANLSFTPDTDRSGKALKAIPGGAGGQLAGMTNWWVFLKSLYDAGLPPNLLSNDFTVIDGIWVQTKNAAPPEERKGFGGGAATGEAAAEEPKSGPIPTVVEILDGGKPWENGGGMPGQAAAAPAPAKPGPVKAGPKPAPPKAGPVKAVAPVAEAPAGDDEVLAAGMDGAADVIQKTPDGFFKVALRTGTFSSVKAKYGDEMAQAVINTFFGSDEGLGQLLEPLGYQVSGMKIVPKTE